MTAFGFVLAGALAVVTLWNIAEGANRMAVLTGSAAVFVLVANLVLP